MTLLEIANALRSEVVTLAASAPASFDGFIAHDNIIEGNDVLSTGKVFGATAVIWSDNEKIEAPQVGTHRQTGLLQLTFKVATNKGDAAILGVAEYFYAALSSRTLTSGVVMSAAQVVSRGVINGWYDVIVSCPFEADTIR